MNVTEFLRGFDAETDTSEIVIDRRTGQPRQAGASQPEGEWIKRFRARAERSLYVFAKGVLGRDRLTPALHRPTCEWLTKIPPYRKLLLMPRDHYKTTIASHVLPMHVHIQSSESNIYFPGRDGIELRVLLACETEGRAAKHVRWVETQWESNTILRGLWPHKVWDNPQKESKKWNERELLLPRAKDFADVSLQAIGVGGAITGGHFDVMVKDDLTTIEAANSPIVMQTAIDWHIASRALMDDPDKSLEFVVGTKWAVHDLPQHIIDNDPTVEMRKHSIVEDGKPIMPGVFSMETVERLKKEFGVLFPLLYMNDSTDPALTDFSPSDLREYEILDGALMFREDERDLLLAERLNAPRTRTSASLRGVPLNRDTYDVVFRRNEYLRLRAS